MIGFEIKQLFFDRRAVTSRVPPATRKVLSKFGAFVRRTAKGSIRDRREPAPPGSPPSSHTGLLKKFIFFGYDAGARSVVVGPARLDRRGRGDAPANAILAQGAITGALILFGKYLEAKAKGSTSEAIKRLMGLQAKTARVVRDGQEVEMSVDDLDVGDIMVVRPGEKIH